jgi:hypothetical protein
MSVEQTRLLYLLLASSFSFALLLKQILTLSIDRKKQLINTLILTSFSTYIGIQMANSWSILEGNQSPGFDEALKFSTILYNISICSILYLSMTRAAGLFQTGIIKTLAEDYSKIFAIAIFAIRTIRTILVFIDFDTLRTILGFIDFDTLNGTVVPLLHLLTLIVVLVVRAVFDVSSLYAIYKISVQTQGFFQASSDYATKRAVKTLILNLVVELMLSALAIFVSMMEAIQFKGDMIAFADWYLISWSIASAVEQRQLYRIIFRTETSSEGQRSKMAPESKMNETVKSNSDQIIRDHTEITLNGDLRENQVTEAREKARLTVDQYNEQSKLVKEQADAMEQQYLAEAREKAAQEYARHIARKNSKKAKAHYNALVKASSSPLSPASSSSKATLSPSPSMPSLSPSLSLSKKESEQQWLHLKAEKARSEIWPETNQESNIFDMAFDKNLL